MQGRVREGGDHLAAIGDDSKGHTSFFRPRDGPRRNLLGSIALRAGSRLGAAECRFPLFPILPAVKRRDHKDVCAFARALVRIRNGGAPLRRIRRPEDPENCLDNL